MFPQEILNLKKLESLKLRDNPIKEIPQGRPIVRIFLVDKTRENPIKEIPQGRPIVDKIDTFLVDKIDALKFWTSNMV